MTEIRGSERSGLDTGGAADARSDVPMDMAMEMVTVSLPTSEVEVQRSQGLSMFTIEETRGRERDQRESWTGRESFGRAALSSQETSTPTVNDGAQDAMCSEMVPSGKA